MRRPRKVATLFYLPFQYEEAQGARSVSNVLNYKTYGDPKNTALLLVHAMGADLRFWEECVPQWESKFFCIAPDLRAAGKSPTPDKPWTIPQHIADLEELRKSLGSPKVVVIGCAMGALVAAAYAARYPEATLALIMTNPGVQNSDTGKEMLRKRVELLRNEGMKALPFETIKRAFLNMPEDRRWHTHVERFTSQDSKTYAMQVAGFIDADISADLPKIKCPMLVVPGEHDVMMPADSAERIKAIVPHAEVQMMTDAAHFMPFQRPDKFAPLAADYVARVVH
jgi:3-oxoadipate enol-lactonase